MTNLPWYLEARKFLPFDLVALRFAQDELDKGVFEHAPNWGPEVEAYLAEVDIHTPAPWCAAFVNWCAKEASKLLNIPSPLEDFELQGWVQAYYNHGSKKGWVISFDKVGPGDLFILYYPSLKRYGHIGFVLEPKATEGWYTTVEGNSNDAGSREGIKIVSKKRNINSGTLFLRYYE